MQETIKSLRLKINDLEKIELAAKRKNVSFSVFAKEILLEQSELILTEQKEGKKMSQNEKLLWMILKHVLGVAGSVRLPHKEDETRNLEIRDFVYSKLDEIKEEIQ